MTEAKSSVVKTAQGMDARSGETGSGSIRRTKARSDAQRKGQPMTHLDSKEAEMKATDDDLATLLREEIEFQGDCFRNGAKYPGCPGLLEQAAAALANDNKGSK